jgi:hypothetical protein
MAASRELAREWSGRIEAIEQLAKQVYNQGYSPLSSTLDIFWPLRNKCSTFELLSMTNPPVPK